MITVGIDIGSKLTKMAIMQDGKLVSVKTTQLVEDYQKELEAALNGLLSELKLDRKDIDKICATGTGRSSIRMMVDEEISEVLADARGAVFLMPSCRTVIDVGAEEARTICCDENGKVKDFTMNEKCAAGAGTFVESMSRALEITVEQFGQLSLKSQKKVPINAQCTIFAESEVVSLLHNNNTKEDICAAVHTAMADRVVSMARRAGVKPDVVMVGGVAQNVGFLKAMEDGLGVKIVVPKNPEYAGSIGAALLLAEGL